MCEPKKNATPEHKQQQVEKDLHIQSPQGHLIPLKTALETRARDTLVQFYVTIVPIKLANTTLNLVRQALLNDGGLDIQHLRRFVKFADLPPEVRTTILTTRDNPTDISDEVLAGERVLLIGSTNAITQEALTQLLSPILETPAIIPLQVPLLAPTSQEQANRWSVKFWPTVYKKSNVFGPHPSIVSRAAEIIEKEAGQWLALAENAADEAYTSGRGEKIGIVIVERRNGVARPLAVAGDARWVGWPRNSAGNATAHAAMRGIAMVAEQVKAAEESSLPAAQPSLPKGASIFRDEAISGLEKVHFMPSEGEGYLCHDLELYCTHEPCVMCSMAIVHSRFGRLAFKHRMPRTGGLCADEELGHGLWWRKELNWTVLAWQWVPDPKSEMEGQNSDIDMNA